MIEESYKLIYSDRNTDTNLGIENNEEISFFIEQIKTVKAIYNSDPQFHVTQSKFLKILHPALLSSLKEVNDEFIKIGIKSYNSPQTIDLFPYLIKYYFKFFLTQKDRFKLLSSPLSFKSSDNLYKPPRSSQSPDRNKYSRSIQLYEPLDKSRIIDLKRVFVAQSPPKVRIEMSKSSPVTFKQPLDEEYLDNNAPSNKENNSILRIKDKKTLTESPIASDKIFVKIDYQQLSQITNTPIVQSKSIHQPSFTAPAHEDQNMQQESLLVNAKNRISLPTRKITDSFISESHPSASESAEPQSHVNVPLLSRRSLKDLVSVDNLGNDDSKISVQDKDEDNTLPLYNNLHIPRKGSDSNYRIFGRHGSTVDDTSKFISRDSLFSLDETESAKSGRSNLETKRILRKRAEEAANQVIKLQPVKESNESSVSKKDHHDTKSVRYGENTVVIGRQKLIPEVSNPPKSPAATVKKKIFEQKEVFISPFESMNNKKGAGIHIEDNLFENIDMNKKNNFKYI